MAKPLRDSKPRTTDNPEPQARKSRAKGKAKPRSGLSTLARAVEALEKIEAQREALALKQQQLVAEHAAAVEAVAVASRAAIAERTAGQPAALTVAA